jgi:hypothetical protein
MKYSRLLILLILPAFVFVLDACNQKPSDPSAATDKTSTETKTVQLDFVRTFEGKINNKYDVVMKLTSNAGQISGKYFYTTIGKDIVVRGDLNNDGRVTLVEYDSKENQIGFFEGTMVNDSKIEGKWNKANESSSAPFVLIETTAQYESLQDQAVESKFEKISGQYEYSNEYSDGSAQISYLGNRRFRFDINVSSGEACSGQVEGEAAFDDAGVGKFSDEGCRSLTFKFIGNKLIIEESDCDYYHGVRCGFYGDYLKRK